MADRPEPATGPSDAELIARSVGEPEHFALLFDRHAAAVHRYLGRRVGELADDLLSETFLVAFRRRGSWRAVHVDVRPWLFGIATNVVHGHVRSEQRRYRLLARAGLERDAELDTDELADRVAAQSLRSSLAAALAALKPADRDVLLLFAWAQLSYGEIAAVQVVPLQVHLAPAGWQLQGFKLSGRVLTLASDSSPDQTLSVHLPEQAYPADELPGRLEQVTGPLREATVHGLPAQLVPTGYGWYLQASFPDGTAFAVQAPPSFTADDVVAVADQVTYTPPAG